MSIKRGGLESVTDQLCEQEKRISYLENNAGESSSSDLSLIESDIASINTKLTETDTILEQHKTTLNTQAGLIATLYDDKPDITNLITSVANIETSLASNTIDIATNTADIATNTADIATNMASISSNTASISSNTADISALETTVASHEISIATNTADIATNTASISSNTADISALETTVASLGNSSVDLTDIEASIATNTANIALNTASIATNTTKIASNTSKITSNIINITVNTTKINTNTANILTNTNNITTLTSSVNSALSAISEMNNGAELTPPLFNITGYSFGTPVYSVSDSYDLQFKRLYSQSYIKPIFFIVEAYSPYDLKIVINLTTPITTEPARLKLMVDDVEVDYAKFESSIETQTEYVFNLTLSSPQKNHKINSYIESVDTGFYHISTKVDLIGKNALFLSKKQKLYILPDIDNQYMCTKTENYLPYVMNTTYDLLDFENGFSQFSGYANWLVHNNYCASFRYIKNEDNTYSKNANFLTLDHKLNNKAYYLYTNVNDYQLNASHIMYLQDYAKIQDTTNNIINYILGSSDDYKLRNVSIYENVSPYYSLELKYIKDHLSSLQFITDARIAQDWFCFSRAMVGMIYVFVDQNGICYIMKYGVQVYITNLGFGSQPYAYYVNDTSLDIYVLKNCYGTIIQVYCAFNTTTNYYEKVSETVVGYGEFALHGFGDEAFIYRNGKITKTNF